MNVYSYEDALIDREKREEFFADYDKVIKQAIKFGMVDTARIHAKNLKRFREEMSIFD